MQTKPNLKNEGSYPFLAISPKCLIVNNRRLHFDMGQNVLKRLQLMHLSVFVEYNNIEAHFITAFFVPMSTILSGVL